MHQQLDMVMLPVSDLSRAGSFYERGLGWIPRGGSQSRHSLKFMAGGVVVTVIDRAYLSEESGLPEATARTHGIVLVIFAGSAELVDQAAVDVSNAGGCITSAPRMRDGGLYTFYFTDPDGNPWEVAWLPDRLPG